ncbi:MAG: hypothetical protein LBK66_12360 [Spirochaetaceae bacterium]|nr:hypothetical protein [Spirochaetaceae bacterium]
MIILYRVEGFTAKSNKYKEGTVSPEQEIKDIHAAQLLSYLRLSGISLGFLFNFNVRSLDLFDNSVSCCRTKVRQVSQNA